MIELLQAAIVIVLWAGIIAALIWVSSKRDGKA